MSSDSIADTSAAIHAAVLAAVDIGIDAELSVQIAELIHAARMPSGTHPLDEESPTHSNVGIAVGSSGAVVAGGASTRDGIEAAAAKRTTNMGETDLPAHLESEADRAKKVAAAAKVRAERNARSAVAAADERRTTLTESDLLRRRAAFMDAFDAAAWTAEIDELVDDPDLTWQDQ